MSESTVPINSRPRRHDETPIVVELSTRQLPTRMRLGGLRSTLGVPSPGLGVLRRVLMLPIAMMTRLLSR